MSKLSKAQEAEARKLMERHNRTEIYVNAESGHMHFTKGGALLGAGDDEKKIVRLSTEEETSKAAAKKSAAKGAESKKEEPAKEGSDSQTAPEGDKE